MASLLCFGEIVVEMVAELVGQSPTEPGNWVGPFPSGAPAILADQAALCGASVRMVGTVGDDDFGTVCTDKLAADGVDTRWVQVDPLRPTGVTFVRYRPDGSRVFIFHIADSASGHIETSDLAEAVADLDCVHVMGSSAFSDSAVKAIVEAVRTATENGAKVSLDPNIRKEMLKDETFAEALRWVLGQASIVLASEGELPLLTTGETDEECARHLLARNAEVVVLKQGDKGSRVLTRAGDDITEPGLGVDEVDPTGAGDCFGGTFLALYLDGRPVAEALKFANAAGAMAVTQRGPMSGNRDLAALREIVDRT